MRQANRRKYHYIYKTTCKVTSKYYIGMHSTDNLEDGYVGSGKRLWYSINKYGLENHVCEILEFLLDRDSLKKREAELVCEDQLTDSMCMNLVPGGGGGFDHVNGKITFDDRSKRGKVGGTNAWKTISGDPEKLSALQTVFDSGRELGKLTHFTKGSQKQANASKASTSKEAKVKRMATMAKNSHQQGAKNSQYGTCWMFSTSEQQSMKISKTDVTKYVNMGWQVGRKLKF